MIVLHPGAVPLATLETVYRGNDAVMLDDRFRPAIAGAAARIAAIVGRRRGPSTASIPASASSPACAFLRTTWRRCSAI